MALLSWRRIADTFRGTPTELAGGSPRRRHVRNSSPPRRNFLETDTPSLHGCGFVAGTSLALSIRTMKPWFVLFTLWALSGIVALRAIYAEDASVFEPHSALQPH